jgi:UDP-N-acetylglucosamine 4-epimerase
MSSRYEQLLAGMRAAPKRWLVTGVAGFIGSNLLEMLLAQGQSVVGFDNFTTGHRANLDAVLAAAGADGAARFRLIEGDLRGADVLAQACHGVDVILHQAAQVSVPASIEDPLTTHEINVTGFLNLLRAAQREGVGRIVYASTCAVYGDSPELPLHEGLLPRPLSPYASSKLADEAYASAMASASGLGAVGLRYFNVFGPRQDPHGAYAAVLPLWLAAMRRGEPVQIFGDGSTTRDFCPIANVVQANLLAAHVPLGESPHDVVNVAVGGQTSLNALFEMLRARLEKQCPHLAGFRPIYRDFRKGDIRHSHASIAKAGAVLGYVPIQSMAEGLDATLAWFEQDQRTKRQ